MAELDHTGALITYYTRGAELISLSRPGEKRFYLYDGQGSVRALSDSDGQVTDTYLYDAFGNLLFRTGTTENDFLYTGEQFDANTGFYYLRARYMKPATGTFTSMDAYAGSIFDPVSLHKYLYANANPVMNRDPSGYYTLTEMEAAMAISGILGAAMNSIPSGIMRLLNGDPMDTNFWVSFVYDFMFGFSVGALFGGLGFLATQYLLASCLLRSIFGTMGLKSTWDFIQDLQRGDWARAILDGLSAVLSFWGASTNFYRGGGLGNSGSGSNAGSASDDAAGASDDAANAADDMAGASDDAAGAGSNDKRYTQDQQTLIDLAKEAKAKGGVTLDDANTLLGWANEYGVPAHGPEIHPSRPGAASNTLHFHIGKTNHIQITD